MPVTLSLLSSNSGAFGTVLWTTDTTVTGNYGSVLSLTDIKSDVELTAGTQYWILLSSTSDALTFWQFPADGNSITTEVALVSGESASYYYGDPGRAMTIGVTVVPEPATYALCFGGAVFGLVLLRRRIRR